MSTPRQALAGALCLALLGVAQAQPAPAATVAAEAVAETQRTRSGLHLTPKQAAEFVGRNKEKVLFVDVRTRAEAVFVGMASPVDALVPYVEFPQSDTDWRWDEARDSYAYEPFNDFAPEIARRLKEKGLTRNDPIVLICRSGQRSARAADLLAGLGYMRVYSVIEGFEGALNIMSGKRDIGGWKNASLPWSYALDRRKMYFVR